MLVAMSILITFPVHLIWSEAGVAAAEDGLRRDGVKLTAELEYVGEVKVGRRYESDMLATYEYRGETYVLNFRCENCRHDKELAVWIEPDDPDVYVTAHMSTASKGNIPVNATLLLLSIPAFFTAILVIGRWRWWLSIPKVRKRRRRPAR
ncbi:hypothetical protein Snas_2468 [Stackebrandtia nassauensis DSM 44728]|uniref:DUF3592 domain-containing protein n=2 Tax=Stackebrandtia TaxID=283810 RepID=D3Q4X1_STANL|nr:hypothetical protein Snas_2468 [Stackebrandtia nassauensis DSM 44728]